MDNNFLLTYSYENQEGMSDSDYDWYETEEKMLEDIEFKKEVLHDFRINEAIQVLGVKNIELK